MAHNRTSHLFWLLLLPLAVLVFVLIVSALPEAHQQPLDYPYGYTTRVLVDEPTGILNYGSSWQPSLSGDGRYVAFNAPMQQIEAGIRQMFNGVFVYDRQTGEILPVSVSDNGFPVEGHSPVISADGRRVAFGSYAQELSRVRGIPVSNIYVRDLANLRAILVTRAYTEGPANASSYDPTLSADGRYVAFVSAASNLVPGDINDAIDVFVADLHTGEIQLISQASDGSPANGDSHRAAISGSGRFVTYYASASNLTDKLNEVGLLLYDRESGKTVSILASTYLGFHSVTPLAIDADGQIVVFLAGRATTRHGYTDDYGLYLYDRRTGKVEPLVQGLNGEPPDGPSSFPTISADGSYISFVSMATNLVEDITPRRNHIYLLDREKNALQRVSISSQGEPGDGNSFHPAISADGKHVAFSSEARNLVAGYVHGALGIFIHDISDWGIYPRVDARRFRQAEPYAGPYPAPGRAPLDQSYPAPGAQPASGPYPAPGEVSPGVSPGTRSAPSSAYPAPLGDAGSYPYPQP